MSGKRVSVSRETLARKVTYSKSDFALEPDVSRETLADFERWEGLLRKWNKKINLVSDDALNAFWQRHALDSWQLATHLPKTKPSFLDLGSGAGFPGVAIAIYLKSCEMGDVTLVESAGKKANFLRTVIRELSLSASVWSGRAEDMEPQAYDVITARAFAPLPRLLDHVQPFWGAETVGLFLKGRGVEKELTEARKYWTFDVESFASRSDPTGTVLRITNLARRI